MTKTAKKKYNKYFLILKISILNGKLRKNKQKYQFLVFKTDIKRKKNNKFR